MDESKAEATVTENELDDIFGGETEFETETASTEEGAETDEEIELGDDNSSQVADTAETTEDTTPKEESDVKDDTAESTEQTDEEKPVENYQFLNAKVNHEDVKYDLSDPAQKETVIKNLQKGMDYDRVKAQVSKLEADNAKLKYLEESLEAIKGDFSSPYDLLDDAMAESLIKNEADHGRTLEKDEAVKRVKANRESLFTQATDSQQKMKDESIKQFADLYPNVKAETIPKEVWDDFTETSDLVGSYRRYESRQQTSELESTKKELESLKAELETLKLNEKNRQRSTGSRTSSGNSTVSATDKMLDDIFGKL